MFSRTLPLPALIELCRALRHYLSAGLGLTEVFRQQALKGAPAVRPVADVIHDSLRRGDALENALEPVRDRFPPLFVSLATVGEQTGNLPEVCRELERYFSLQHQLRRQFLAQIAWPVIQFAAAIVVVTLLIWVLGIVGGMNPGGEGFDPIGLGTGAGPALGFLLGSLGLVALVLGGLVWARRVFRGGRLDALLLRVPVIGPCLHALALARFCLALRLTTETGMPIGKALRLSLEATGNAAFAATAPAAVTAVKGGDDLVNALAVTRVFPEEFQHVVAVGEESGRIPEVLEQQGEHYQEEAERRLRVLTHVAAWGVWLAVAVLIIFMIFRIFLTYLGMLDPARYGL